MGLFSIQPSARQNITITSIPSSIAAGPDYATDVLSNPWDFSDQMDLSPFPDEMAGWTISSTTAKTVGRSAFLNNGLFSATTAAGDLPQIPMLYRGALETITSSTETAGVFNHKAIPTGNYGKLAVMMATNITPGGSIQALWFDKEYAAAPPRARSLAFRPTTAGAHLYLVDLVTGKWTDARGNVADGTFGAPFGLPQVAWDDAPLMRGLQLRATTSAGPSFNVQVDWVRVTSRDGAGGPTMPVSFTGCTSHPYSIEAQVGAGGPFEAIHAANSASTQSTTAQVNYGVLAPGTWSIRVACYVTNNRNDTPQFSPASQVTINDPPHLTIANPDARGGTDFATTVKGNAWDMCSLSDVTPVYGISDPQIVSEAGGCAYQARSAVGTDSGLYLLTGSPVIDTSRFRHLTFTLTLDTPFGLDGNQGQGSVARVFWEGLAGGVSSITVGQDILVWPGRNSYSFDLSLLNEPNGIEPECGECANLPWTAVAVRNLEFDPHEAIVGLTWRLGPVTITESDSVASGSTFPVQYSFTDADASNSTYSARFYLDGDRNAGGRVLVGTATSVQANTPLTFNLSPGSVNNGEYFLFIEIEERRPGNITDIRGLYASGPLRVGPSGPQAPGAPVLVATQTTNNPVSVAWTPGAGGPVTQYILTAGTAPGATNFGTFNMGLQTAASGPVSFGIPIFVRVTAFNSVGATTSNELSFVAGPVLPGQPTLRPVNPPINRTVVLTWDPPTTGGTPTDYVVVARYPGNPAIIATLGVTATTLTVPNVPPGSYVVTVVAHNAAGYGPESGSVIVTVP